MQQRKLSILLTVGLLLVLASTAVSADDPPPIKIEEDWEGWVASEQLRSPLPAKESNGKIGPDGVAPNSVDPVPGGGYAWAQAYLGWTPLRMDGIAKTGLSSGVIVDYYCAARVKNVYKDGDPKGGTGHVGYWIGGGMDVQAKKSVYGWVEGHHWENRTSHLVTDFEWYEWGPQHSVSVDL